ncbi:hypothetical protein [Asaia lannensis]|uniref:hypothetical protein n=1 Tax=Asaia lannensis TaxID=415421 RepID=UPI0038735AAE
MKITRFVLFLWSVAFFGFATFTLLKNGYLSDIVLRQISDHVIRSRVNAEQTLDTMPYAIPSLIYDAAAWAFGSIHEIVPILTAILASGGLVWLAANPAASRRSPLWTGLFTATLVLNPILLWTATATGGRALAVLIFAYMCCALLQIAERHDLGGYLKFGLASSLFILTDPTAIVLCVAMIPWIVLTAASDRTERHPVAYYLVTFAPIAMATLSVCYLNWAELGHFSPFITPLNAGNGQDFTWDAALHAAGVTDRLDIVPIFMIMTLLFFPVLILVRPLEACPARRAFVVALLTVVTIPIIVSLAAIPYHVLDYLPYLAGPLIIVALRTSTRHRTAVLGIQIASIPLGWTLLAVPGSSLPEGWAQAMTGKGIAGHSDDKAIAAWIVNNKKYIALDPITDYRVVALVGRSDDFVMPVDFVSQTTAVQPDARAILTTRPNSAQGETDRINGQAPMMWSAGMPGYKLAFERGIYRVWVRSAHS